MSYGLRVINVSGFEQIDATYDNFVLHQSGTVSAEKNTEAIVTYADTGGLPIVAIRTVSGASMGLSYVSNTQATFVGGNDGAATVEYRVYRRLGGLSPSSTFGLRVYNGAGGLTFDSGREYLRISQLATFTPSESIFSLNHSFGNAFAILSSPVTFTGVYRTSNPNWWVLPAIKTSNNLISVGECLIPTGVPPTGSPFGDYFNTPRVLGVVRL